MICKIFALLMMMASVDMFALHKQLSPAEAKQQAAMHAQQQKIIQTYGQEHETRRSILLKTAQKACFTKGTLVLSASERGECKAIEDIKVGDAVLSYDRNLDALVAKQVEEVFRISTSSLVELSFENDQFLRTTENHLFHLSESQEWIAAGDLREGDLLSTNKGDLRLASVSIRDLDEPLIVYDFSVESTHNYFVVASGECSGDDTGILVHNCNTGTEFGKGVILGASESLPGASQHPRKGSKAFEAGRATGEVLGGAAQTFAGGTTFVAGGTAATASCFGAACAAAPVGVGVAAAGAAFAAHGAAKVGEGVNHFFSQGQNGGVFNDIIKSGKAPDFQKTHSIGGNPSTRNVKNLMDDMITNGWKGEPVKVLEHNGEKYVLDGHHRLEAARRTGTNVEYKIVTPENLAKETNFKNVDEVLSSASEAGRNKLRM